MNWTYGQPKFEYEKDFHDVAWPWAGHKYFAYDLVANLEPRKIVELGTHKGTSFFSFCQAAKDQKLKTEINAVDTWEGDEHAGFYGDEIYAGVQNSLKKYYSNINAKLIRKIFDEALGQFENASIDILHIDGLHTYEAVKHDFEFWLPKVKGDGVILFHDIEVGEKDFGVYKLWEEMKKRYKTIEFHHSFGLGVLFVDEKMGMDLSAKQKEFEMHYSHIHEKNKSLAVHNMEQKNNQLREKLRFMETSKFWKLRNFFIITKKALHIDKK